MNPRWLVREEGDTVSVRNAATGELIAYVATDPMDITESAVEGRRVRTRTLMIGQMIASAPRLHEALERVMYDALGEDTITNETFAMVVDALESVEPEEETA